MSPEDVIVDAAAPLFGERWADWCEVRATVVLPTVVVDEDTAGALSQLAWWFRFLRDHDDRLQLAHTAGDIRRSRRQGKTAVLLHFQSSRPLGPDLGLVEAFFRLGVRVMQLAYNVRGALGDGSLEALNGGLTRLGHAAIREMNRCGMLIDGSHAGIRTSLEAIEASSKPVIFSHSNAMAVCAHPRNLTDEQIRACAASDGVIGINAFPAFVKAGKVEPTTDDLIDHIEHVSELAGVEHVGLGLDFFDATAKEYQRMIESGNWNSKFYPPPPYRYPAGLQGPSGIPELANRLRERGFNKEAVQGVLGGNFMRVFESAWPGDDKKEDLTDA